MNTLSIHTDGGARGNPGPAAIGVVFQLDGWQDTYQRYIGHSTNNVAEYTAVLNALQLLPRLLEEHELSPEAAHFYLDSQLVQRQILGEYKIKEPTLQILCKEVRQELAKLPFPYQFSHVPRAENAAADKLVNHALDAAIY